MLYHRCAFSLFVRFLFPVSGKKVSVAYERIPATFDMLKRNPRTPSENRIKVQFWGKHTGELHRKKFTKEHEKETITFLHDWNRFFWLLLSFYKF